MKLIILIASIWLFTLLALSGCGSGDGADGVQSDADYNATKPLIPTPPILQPFEGSVSEKALPAEVIGTMLINNLDGADIVGIVLSGNGFENFLVDIEGLISVGSGAILDYETMNIYNLIATAIDSTGNNVSATTLIISVVDIDESPQEVPVLDVAGATGSVVENSPAGTMITTVAISSGGDSPITAITLSGSGSEKFIASTVGLISVASGAVLSVDELYTLDAVAINGAGSSEAAVVTISVTVDDTAEEPEPEPEPPIPLAPTLADSTSSVVENSPEGTSAGSITISAVGDTAISAIVLSGSGSQKFTAVPSGALSVASGAVLTKDETYSLIAKATNSVGESNPATVTITITADAVPDTVPTLAGSVASVGRLAPEGTVVGKITIVDGGDSAISKFTLIGAGQDDFLVATDGTISVASGAIMVASRVYNLIAKATNSAGDSAPVMVTITVT